MIFPELSDTGPFIAILVRAIVPLSMLRWPLGGLAASILADALDVVIVAAVQIGTYDNYTATDKFFDTYSLAISASIALTWSNTLARRTAIVLFAIRIIGVVAVVLTGFGSLFFLFPNIFEMFYAYHLVTVKWFPQGEVGGSGNLTVVIVVLSMMKLSQEFVLHISPILTPFLFQAIVLTACFCLPPGLVSLIYARLHSSRGDSRGEHTVMRAKNLGWITVGIGLWFFVFWTGLAILNFMIAYSGGV